MPSQTVYEFQPGVAFPDNPPSSSPYFVHGSVVSICESPAFSRPSADELADSNPDGLGCARGIRSAFMLEAGVAILAYGIWHLWHLVHIAH